MKQLILVVTQPDIQNARAESGQRDCSTCPIAQSLQRRYPGARVYVGYDEIRVNDVFKAWTTGKMEVWMSRFDDGKPVSPTAFFLDCSV